MKNILVSIDFNNNEQLLIEKAKEFGKAFKSKVWLLHVAAPDPDFVGYGVGPQYIRDDRAEEIRDEHVKLQKYTKQLTDLGLDAEGLLIQGATVEMIVEESKKLNIDLLITGYHEHGFFYKALVGSISSKIIKKSEIPLLLIPLD